MKATSGQTINTEKIKPQVIHRGPVYPDNREPSVNVFFTDSHSGLSIQVKLRREITDWLESMSTEEVNNVIRDSLEMWKPTK